MIKIFLSFDFYGAGNIGDDLMLDGFLKALKNNDYEFYCLVPRNSLHQQMRFPVINFFEFKERTDAAKQCSVWAGVGDTPVQVKSGDWFLQKLFKDNELIGERKIKYYFIGVGAEREAVSQKDKFAKVLGRVDHFWTRDSKSTEILVNDLKIQSDKVTTSSDLANISLSETFRPVIKKNRFKYDIGICYYDENAEEENLTAIKLFLKKIKKRNKKILFSNDVSRKGLYEYNLYKKMFTRLERIYNNIRIYQPDYFNSSKINELVSHYTECETVMSSRYHAILTAAWAGCRVIALERSSKVSALAEELCISEVKKPFTVEKLMEAFNGAKMVSPEILNTLLKSAYGSISNFEELIKTEKTQTVSI
ncbi:MAG: polysaccharide pyruvyl transferase family protein [Ignavibacteria bacterium]|nr:polysaccharide pyruvyl transferase family protein [Ignavibacteria bacterium]